jgi:hypothetical protein
MGGRRSKRYLLRGRRVGRILERAWRRWATDLQTGNGLKGATGRRQICKAVLMRGCGVERQARLWLLGLSGGMGFGFCGTKKPDAPQGIRPVSIPGVRRSAAGPVPPPANELARTTHSRFHWQLGFGRLAGKHFELFGGSTAVSRLSSH